MFVFQNGLGGPRESWATALNRGLSSIKRSAAVINKNTKKALEDVGWFSGADSPFKATMRF